MELTETTDDLNGALQDMQRQGKAVNDSLKALADQGIERLSGMLQKATVNAETATRRSEGSIVQEELQKILRQEAVAVFGGLLGQGEGGNIAGAANSGINVIVNNNAQASVYAQERTDAFDQRTLEITIDQMVADSMLRGRQTGGVMRTLFGLVPTLIGR